MNKEKTKEENSSRRAGKWRKESKERGKEGQREERKIYLIENRHWNQWFGFAKKGSSSRVDSDSVH